MESTREQKTANQEHPHGSILPADTLEIEYDGAKLFGLILLGLLLTAASVGMTLSSSLRFQVFVGYFGTVFFGLATIKALWSLLRSSGPIITITPDGIRDTRIAAQFIPWKAIERIWTWSSRGSKFMVLVLKPGAIEQLRLTLLAQWTRIPNRLLGVNGLAIGATGLDVDYQTLLDKSLAYLRAQRS